MTVTARRFMHWRHRPRKKPPGKYHRTLHEALASTTFVTEIKKRAVSLPKLAFLEKASDERS